ncbi:MAG: TIR domain-containing protein [Bacteroidota bacterium]
MTLTEIKKTLKHLLINDRDKAITAFGKVLSDSSSKEHFAIIRQGAYNSLKERMQKNTISEENANIQISRISDDYLSVINDLEEEDVDFAKAEAVLSKQDEVTPPSPPPSSTSQIYISYAWGGASEKIVNLLDNELQEKGITVIRDKRNLGYRGSIIEFMRDIGNGNKVIVVISEKYLRSENCMYELTQIYENKDFAKRIFPIVLEDANIYSPIGRLQYIKFWNDKIEELDTAIKSSGPGLNLTQIQQELNNYGNIRAAFDNMAFILKDMNALTPEIHRNQNFQTLYEELMKN